MSHVDQLFFMEILLKEREAKEVYKEWKILALAKYNSGTSI